MYSPEAPPFVANQPQVVQGIQPGTNVIIIPGYAPSSGPYTRYNGRLSMILGIIQICLAICSIILGSVMIELVVTASFVGSGIWCAVLYIIAGAFGIGAKTGNRCMVLAHMVLSIIAAVFTSIPFSLSIIGAIFSEDYYWRDDGDADLGVSIALIFVTFAEALVATVASVLCCKAACCGVQQPQTHLAGAGGVQYVVASGENSQMLLQPMYGQTQPSTSFMPQAAPPQYEEKTHHS